MHIVIREGKKGYYSFTNASDAQKFAEKQSNKSGGIWSVFKRQ